MKKFRLLFQENIRRAILPRAIYDRCVLSSVLNISLNHASVAIKQFDTAFMTVSTRVTDLMTCTNWPSYFGKMWPKLKDYAKFTIPTRLLVIHHQTWNEFLKFCYYVLWGHFYTFPFSVSFGKLWFIFVINFGLQPWDKNWKENIWNGRS